MDNFINWLKNNDVDLSNIQIIDRENNERGILSKQKMDAGDFVFLIPKHLLITDLTADKLEEARMIKSIFQNKHYTEINIIKIAVFMLYVESFDDIHLGVDWRPYFDILPENQEHVPIFWEDELNYLKGSLLLDRITKRIKMIEEEYIKLKENIPDFEQFSLYEYKYMRSIVSSRNFKLIINGVTVSAMVPLADMLNHSNKCPTRWSYNDNLNSYQMVTNSEISKGVEITDSYGIKPMDNYFVYYGFVLPESTARVQISFKQFNGYLTKKIDSIETKEVLNYFRNKKSYDFVARFNNKQNDVEAIKKLLVFLNNLKDSYPYKKKHYQSYKRIKNQNKKNAYMIIFNELDIIDILIEKYEIILKVFNNKKVNLKYDDVRAYVKRNVIMK